MDFGSHVPVGVVVVFGGCGAPLIRVCPCPKLELTGAHKAATVRPSTNTPFLLSLIAQLLPANAGQNNKLPQNRSVRYSAPLSRVVTPSVCMFLAAPFLLLRRHGFYTY